MTHITNIIKCTQFLEKYSRKTGVKMIATRPPVSAVYRVHPQLSKTQYEHQKQLLN